LAEQRVAARATVLATAYATHPERFLAGLPHPPASLVEVWINPPKVLVRSQASSNTQPSHLRWRAHSPSLSSVAAL
jgi:putative transposase